MRYWLGCYGSSGRIGRLPSFSKMPRAATAAFHFTSPTSSPSSMRVQPSLISQHNGSAPSSSRLHSHCTGWTSVSVPHLNSGSHRQGRANLACLQENRGVVRCLSSVSELSTSGAENTKGNGNGGKPMTAFESLGLRDTLLDALEELGLDTPSEIQSLAIESILEGEGKLDALGQNGILLASHTGSGKTLAYLLPVVQQLKRYEEDQEKGRSAPKRPRCIVVAPTQELVEQIFQVAKSLGHVVKFSSAMVSARSKMSVQKKSMERPVDLLVGTPSRILRLNRDGFVWYGDVRYLVLDEADLLIDDDYIHEVMDLVTPVLNKPEKAKVLMATASKTRTLEKFLHEELGGGLQVETTSLHKAVSNAKHQFINQGQSDKLELLERTILPNVEKNHGLVFCNTLNSCRAVEHYLKNNDYNSFCLHGSVPAGERKEVLKDFLGEKSGLLITTDLAARGLDFGGKVRYVVNFDFPHNKVDYLHRTGRTARAGKRGQVFSLVRGRDRKLAREIELAVKSKETIQEKAKHRTKQLQSSHEENRPKARRASRRDFPQRKNGGKGGSGDGGRRRRGY